MLLMCGGRGTGLTHFIGWSGLRSLKYSLNFGWFVLSTSGQDKPFQSGTADDRWNGLCHVLGTTGLFDIL